MAVIHKTEAWRGATGYHRRERDPGIAFFGSAVSDFSGFGELLARLKASNPRLGIVLIAADAAVKQRLGEQFPDVRIEVPPLAFAGTAILFLSTLRIRAFVILSRAAAPKKHLMRALTGRATPIARFTDASDPGISVDALLDMVGRDRKWDQRRDRKLGRLVGEALFTALENPARRRRLARWIVRHDSLAALAERLGHPHAILCLGNGPSSEAAELDGIRHDVLFRANHKWLKRGRFEHPHVVFTGAQATMKKIRSAILGVFGESTEKVLLMSRGPTALAAPLEYFAADKIVDTGAGWEGLRPTSGAVMLAVAVALQPERLVIAGMDLFKHPAGAYPGGGPANAYTPAHDAGKELGFILHVLGEFRGELQILSPVLADEWRRSRP